MLAFMIIICYNGFSEKHMKKVLENFCNDKSIKKGLLLIEMPTGTGKTYSVAEYIADNYEQIDGKIFFVTQLKKNLPEEDKRKKRSPATQTYKKKIRRVAACIAICFA